MYDTFSSDYDRFVNWPSRLSAELPFIEQQLKDAPGSPPRVLDAAAGTGMHAIALARRGYPAAGADLSAGMVEQARRNAEQANLDVPFTAAGFGELAKHYPAESFDAVLCLGNSLPHLLERAALDNALCDFAAVLRPGGLLLLQNRNFDAVMAQRERWMEPQGYVEPQGYAEPQGPVEGGGREWVFLRFYDYRPDGLIDFNVVTLHRSGNGGWQQSVATTPLYPLRESELTPALQAAGFTRLQRYGNMNGDPFNPQASGNLVVVAHKGEPS